MRLKLEGCEHRYVVAYDGNHATCLSCYRRIVTEDPRHGVWEADIPAGLCNHPRKKPITDMKARTPFQDAMCLLCGCVVRHPNGPGQWFEVIFNGYIIQEEP